MSRLKFLACFLAIASCADPAAPAGCGPFPAIVQPALIPDTGNLVDVATEAQLLEGLRAGHNTFRLTNTIVITRPIVLDSFPIGSFFALSGNGGYGAHIVRGFDGPEPLLSFTGPAWFLRLKGLTFLVPDWMKHAGPSIYVHKAFVSGWWDVMFEYHPHRPFVIDGGSALTFYNLSLQSNGESALIREVADAAFFGGNWEDHRYDAPNHGTGIEVYATRDIPHGAIETPLRIDFPHMEFSHNSFHHFTRARVYPGYCLLCRLELVDVGCVA